MGVRCGEINGLRYGTDKRIPLPFVMVRIWILNMMLSIAEFDHFQRGFKLALEVAPNLKPQSQWRCTNFQCGPVGPAGPGVAFASGPSVKKTDMADYSQQKTSGRVLTSPSSCTSTFG